MATNGRKFSYFLGHETICRIAIQILEQKAFCQQDPDQDETEEAPEDQAEYDSVLISSAGDLVASLANALGADFAPAFNGFFPLISKYYVSSLIPAVFGYVLSCLFIYFCRNIRAPLAIVHHLLVALPRSYLE